VKLGYRSRLFLASVALVLAVGATSAIYLESELRSWLENRMEEELFGHASSSMAALGFAKDAMEVKDFDTIANDLGRHLRRRVTLINSDGRVIGDSSIPIERLSDVENHRERPEVIEAAKTGRGAARRTSATLGTRMLYVAMPFKHANAQGVLRIATPLSLVDQTVSRMRIFIMVASGIGLALAIFISLLTSHLLSRRFKLLLGRAHKMADTHGQLSLRQSGADEITVLHRSLDHLGESLEHVVATLAHERDRFAAVLDGMEEAVIAVDEARRVTLVNPAALQFLEVESVELGTPLDNVIRSHEILDAFERAIGGQGTEFDIIARDDTRHVLCRAAPSGSSPGCIMVLHDVTRLRRLERMRRDFVANVSHELRTPVSVIRINAEALADGAMADPTSGPRFVSALLRNAERLSDLISDLLDVSRIESGLYEMEPNLIDLNESVSHAIESVEELAQKKHIVITTSGVGPLMVSADKRALQHVLINLLQNAVRYTQDAGHIDVKAEYDVDMVRLEVMDNGPGIPDRYHRRIFERFFRVDKGRSTHMGGTGLGLSIVKHLAGNMGGEVGVRNNTPQGAVFWVTLPTETETKAESTS
jgi:two-component system phosphate regulon sensor histidine kinase PhoR